MAPRKASSSLLAQVLGVLFEKGKNPVESQVVKNRGSVTAGRDQSERIGRNSKGNKQPGVSFGDLIRGLLTNGGNAQASVKNQIFPMDVISPNQTSTSAGAKEEVQQEAVRAKSETVKTTDSRNGSDQRRSSDTEEYVPQSTKENRSDDSQLARTQKPAETEKTTERAAPVTDQKGAQELQAHDEGEGTQSAPKNPATATVVKAPQQGAQQAATKDAPQLQQVLESAAPEKTQTPTQGSTAAKVVAATPTAQATPTQAQSQQAAQTVSTNTQTQATTEASHALKKEVSAVLTSSGAQARTESAPQPAQSPVPPQALSTTARPEQAAPQGDFQTLTAEALKVLQSKVVASGGNHSPEITNSRNVLSINEMSAKVNIVSAPGFETSAEKSATAKSTVLQRLTAPQQTKVIDRIQQIAEDLTIHKTPTSLILRLDPPELGELTIKLSQRADHLFARVSADSPEVERFLNGKVHEITQALAVSGVKSDNIHVVVGPERSESEYFSFGEGYFAGQNGGADQKRESNTQGASSERMYTEAEYENPAIEFAKGAVQGGRSVVNGWVA